MMKTGSGKKLGDVVAYKPYLWTWGGMGIKHYLILVVDGITEEEYAGVNYRQLKLAACNCTPPQFLIRGFGIIMRYDTAID